ncbi:MAG: enoyl-CoA hydratase-related protein, partial [Alphaproteobacteria bacterium]
GAAGDFKIGMNETAIGMVLPVFGLEMAKCRLSNIRMTEAFIQAQLYGPEEAVEVGFLDQVLPADQVIDAALAEAARLGGLPNGAYFGNKMLLRKPYADIIEPSLASPISVLG